MFFKILYFFWFHFRYSLRAMLANDVEKREIIENIVWNLSFKNKNMLKYQFKSPYSALLNVPKNADISVMRNWRDSNPRGRLGPTSLAKMRIQPLSHSSMLETIAHLVSNRKREDVTGTGVEESAAGFGESRAGCHNIVYKDHIVSSDGVARLETVSEVV